MKKFMLDLVVKDNKTLNNQYSLIILGSSKKLPEMNPGQFAEVKVDNDPNTYLRRPISINYVEKMSFCCLYKELVKELRNFVI